MSDTSKKVTSKKANKKQQPRQKKVKAPKGSKKSGKEGNRVASRIKAAKTEAYIVDVSVEDTATDVVFTAKSVVRTLGKVRAAFMIIAPGSKELVTVVYVPDELKERLDGKEWLTNSTFGEITEIDGFFVAKNWAEIPFKLTDTVRSSGFKYLKEHGLMEEEESSEELPDFDDLDEFDF